MVDILLRDWGKRITALTAAMVLASGVSAQAGEVMANGGVTHTDPTVEKFDTEARKPDSYYECPGYKEAFEAAERAPSGSEIIYTHDEGEDCPEIKIIPPQKTTK